MIAARWSAEPTLRRAAGASLWQLFLVRGGRRRRCLRARRRARLDGGGAGGPRRGPGRPGPPGGRDRHLVFATAAPGGAAAWQQTRLPEARDGQRRGQLAARVVVEVTPAPPPLAACTTRVSGPGLGATHLCHQRRPGADSGACARDRGPAAVSELLLRALARHGPAARSDRVPGPHPAAQAPLALTLPALTLVLALTVAAFTGMVKDAVAERGTRRVVADGTGATWWSPHPVKLGIGPRPRARSPPCLVAGIRVGAHGPDDDRRRRQVVTPSSSTRPAMRPGSRLDRGVPPDPSRAARPARRAGAIPVLGARQAGLNWGEIWAGRRSEPPRGGLPTPCRSGWRRAGVHSGDPPAGRSWCCRGRRSQRQRGPAGDPSCCSRVRRRT